MQKETVLLIDADGDCEEAVAFAAAQAGCRVQWVRTARDFFSSFCQRLSDFAFVVIDIDPGSHGMALLEAISACADRPPVIVLTGLEKGYVEPISRAHGAGACLGKPIARQELASNFQNIRRLGIPSCDRWGHKIPARIKNSFRKIRALRGIAQKLRPVARTENHATVTGTVASTQLRSNGCS